MSDSPNNPMYVGENPQGSFFQTWTKALTQPREETYAELAVSPGASPSKAYVWIFLASLLSYFLILAAQALVLGLGNERGGNVGSALGGIVITLICAGPFIAGFSVLGFMLDTAIIQWIAGLLGGHGNYSRLAYVFGAIAAPITLTLGLLGALAAIPLVGLCFDIVIAGLGLYMVILESMAIKAVNRLDWLPAVGSVLLPRLVIGGLCVFIIISSLGLLAYMGAGVFSEINQSLIVP